jgi:hypothetical protein
MFLIRMDGMIETQKVAGEDININMKETPNDQFQERC